MISQGVRKANGQSMTLADAMLQVGADHPTLYEAYVEGQQAGAFVATPKQPVRKTTAPRHAYLVAVESRISKADLKTMTSTSRRPRRWRKSRRNSTLTTAES